MMPKRPAVGIRRVYDPPGTGEGYRALVDRLWPRGVKRAPDLFDGWAKEAAPSPDLRHWYGHDPAKFAEFAERYRAELAGPPAQEALAHLVELARQGAVTLLTATKDVDRSGAFVLARAIEDAATARHR